MLTKTMTALAAVATIAIGAIAAPQQAEARYYHRHHGYGGAVAAGVIGGLALGGLAGGYYGPSYAYAPGPYYGYGGCGWRRERVWDGWGWRVRRVRVCY